MAMEEAPSLTVTQRAQKQLEDSVVEIFREFAESGKAGRAVRLELWKEDHIEFLLRGLRCLGPSYSVLDCSRPWLCYWILHSLALLGESVPDGVKIDIINFLQRCQDPGGGFAGGPGQMPHLATTYAAVCSLVTLGGEEALRSIKRKEMLEFLQRMKDNSGGFRMHDGGETDVRGCYTAIAVAHMLNIIVPELLENLAEFITSCQTYEGGIGGEPGAEAHGGYTFCGVAALIIANKVESLNLPKLLEWVTYRQGRVEGGFQGRTNKLVDGCYSFWQGGIFSLFQEPTLHQSLVRMSRLRAGDPSDIGDIVQINIEGTADTHTMEDNLDAETFLTSMLSADRLFVMDGSAFQQANICNPIEKQDAGTSQYVKCETYASCMMYDNVQCAPLFNSRALQGYLLLCCQNTEGGLIDKPGKQRDYYHTCYCLSGMSIAQNCYSKYLGAPPPPRAVIGSYVNLLEAIHPVMNVCLQRYHEAVDYFEHFPSL